MMSEDCDDKLEIRPWPNQDDLTGLFIDPQPGEKQNWAKIPVTQGYALDFNPSGKKTYTMKFNVPLIESEAQRDFLESLKGEDFIVTLGDLLANGRWDEENSEITITWEADIHEDWNIIE